MSGTWLIGKRPCLIGERPRLIGERLCLMDGARVWCPCLILKCPCSIGATFNQLVWHGTLEPVQKDGREQGGPQRPHGLQSGGAAHDEPRQSLGG